MFSKFDWVRRKLRLDTEDHDPFRDVVFDEGKFARAMSWKAPATRYVVFFTPRSGSSRLTDLAERTKALGHPGECFNPAFIPAISQAFSARNIEEYVPLLLRHRQTRGVFGCEVTHMHVTASYPRPQDFLEAVNPTATLWLIREDIIAQAVSVTRMMQTKVSHSVMSDPDAIKRAEDTFRYDPRAIANVLKRLRRMEDGTETLIRDAGLTPMRLSYEGTIAARPRRLMVLIGAHVGVRPGRMDLDAVESDHRKISGGKSNDFADRFRAEHPEIVAQLDMDRAPMLAAHAEAQKALAPGAAARARADADARADDRAGGCPDARPDDRAGGPGRDRKPDRPDRKT